MNLQEAQQDLTTWLYRHGKDSKSVLAFLRDYVHLLKAKYKLPVDRIFFGSELLHPQAEVCSWIFEAPDTFHFRPISPEEYQKLETDLREPLTQLEDPNTTSVRIRNGDAIDTIAPHILKLLVQGGGTLTDMYALPVFSNEKCVAGITWSTQCPTGWTQEQIDFFNHCLPMLDMTLNLLLQKMIMHNLLCTYLGKDPGSRVSSGSVFRGKGITVRSVVWFSDVRGFTSLSSRLERDAVIDLINDVFELTEDVLGKYRGEILKFMGDGILAVFREPDLENNSDNDNGMECDGNKNDNADDDARSPRASLPCKLSASICNNGAKAAEELQLRLAKLSESRVKRGLSAMEVGVGLHYGDCSYGNVGAPSRLDFTVIGNSVNVASRVEGLCSKLEASILATDDFVQRLVNSSGRKDDWTFKGEHLLKGVKDPVCVHELKVK